MGDLILQWVLWPIDSWCCHHVYSHAYQCVIIHILLKAYIARMRRTTIDPLKILLQLFVWHHFIGIQTNEALLWFSVFNLISSPFRYLVLVVLHSIHTDLFWYFVKFSLIYLVNPFSGPITLVSMVSHSCFGGRIMRGVSPINWFNCFDKTAGRSFKLKLFVKILFSCWICDVTRIAS